MMLAVVFIAIGWLTHNSLAIGSKNLYVDPMSIFVDPMLYRFCWKSKGEPFKKTIEIINEQNGVRTSLQIFKVNNINKTTFCIENRDNTNRYKIELPIMYSNKSTDRMPFSFQFNYPLGPQLDIVQIRSVSRGVYFELNSKFAGLTTVTSKTCQVILTSDDTFQPFTLNDSEDRKFLEIEKDSLYSVYYTCRVKPYFDINTRPILKSGFIDYVTSTIELLPVVQMPFRRFIMASWLPNRSPTSQYQVAIYLRELSGTFSCIKIFRIHKNTPMKDKNLVSNCGDNIPVEDMAYYGGVGDKFLSVIFDMGTPLRMYQKYKFSIFWIDSKKNLLNLNFVYFTPLPNENIGYINSNLITIDWEQPDVYTNLMKFNSPIEQSVLSLFNKNPYRNPTINTNYGLNLSFQVTSSAWRSKPKTCVLIGNYGVSELYDKCDESKVNQSFFPFFYAIFNKTISNNHVVEIVQIPVPKNLKTGQVNFVSDNEKLRFDVSWKITGYPTPAMFALEIVKDDVDTCHLLYILTCRTCNEIYNKDTIKSANHSIQSLVGNCSKTFYLHGHFDAIDSSVDFSTKPMPPSIAFTARLHSFVDLNYTVSQKTKAKHITASFWQTNGKMITGIICGVVVTSILILLCLCCKYLSREPNGKNRKEESLDDNTYDQEDKM